MVDYFVTRLCARLEILWLSETIFKSIRVSLELCLVTRFDMYPMVLVPDGASMIDRRIGLYGHPFDIQHCSMRLKRQYRTPDS